MLEPALGCCAGRAARSVVVKPRQGDRGGKEAGNSKACQEPWRIFLPSGQERWWRNVECRGEWMEGWKLREVEAAAGRYISIA